MTLAEELDLRRRQLAERDGKIGYKDNVVDLKARIAALKQLIAGGAE